MSDSQAVQYIKGWIVGYYSTSPESLNVRFKFSKLTTLQSITDFIERYSRRFSAIAINIDLAIAEHFREKYAIKVVGLDYESYLDYVRASAIISRKDKTLELPLSTPIMSAMMHKIKSLLRSSLMNYPRIEMRPYYLYILPEDEFAVFVDTVRQYNRLYQELDGFYKEFVRRFSRFIPNLLMKSGLIPYLTAVNSAKIETDMPEKKQEKLAEILPELLSSKRIYGIKLLSLRLETPLDVLATQYPDFFKTTINELVKPIIRETIETLRELKQRNIPLEKARKTVKTSLELRLDKLAKLGLETIRDTVLSVVESRIEELYKKEAEELKEVNIDELIETIRF